MTTLSIRERGAVLLIPPELHLLSKLEAKAKTYSLVSRGRIARIIGKIRSSSDTRSFAKLLRAEPDARAIFSQHWSQLSLLEEASIPVLFSLNVEADDARAVVERETRRAEEAGGFTIERIFGEAKPRLMAQLESLARNLKDSGAWAEGGPDQETVMLYMFKALGLFQSGSPLKGAINLAKPYEDFIADDLPNIALSLLAITKSKFLGFGAARRAKTMKATGLEEGKYEKVLSTLVDDGYVQPLVSIVWCGRHKEPTTSAYIAGHRALPKVSCEVCSRRLSHGTLFSLSPGAMTLARQYDGILPYLIALDLEERELPWNAECYLEGEASDREKDIIYRPAPGRLAIVECKTFATDVPLRTVKTNLTTSVAQLREQVESMNEHEIPVTNTVLATNYVLDSDGKSFLDSLLKEATNEVLHRTSFKAIGPGELGILPGPRK